MISIFHSDVRREFRSIIKLWFGCAIAMGVAFPIIAAFALAWVGFAMGASPSDLAWTFLRDSQEPMLLAVSALHFFGVVAVFVGYGFGVEISSLLFSGGGSILAALIAVSAALIGLAFRAATLRVELGIAARRADFALGFPTFRPSRAGLLRASNPAGAVPRLE